MNNIIIYESKDQGIKLDVQFEGESFWLSLNQISELFERDKSVISRHLSKIFKTQELDRNQVVAKHATTADDGKVYQVNYYNLDAILSVGYRVNSKRGTQFRQWATQRLKDYLVEGYAINETRLAEKNQEIQYLKTGFQILTSTIKDHIQTDNDTFGITELMTHFSKGLTLLDDYDHETLDQKGHHTITQDPVTSVDLYPVIDAIKSDFSSPLFGQERDGGFQSAVAQIYQSFGDSELYPTLEEKAAVLL